MRIIKNIYNIVKILFIKFVRLFFSYLNGGSQCIVCGRTTYFYPICGKCTKKFFNINKEGFENRCKKCGRELISTKNICTSCKEKSIFKNIDNIIPLFSYRLWNKELLFLWKIKEVRNLSFFFAFIVNKALKFNEYKIIVPVPPRKGKIKRKGWDQINELCNVLCSFYGYTVLNLLERLSSSEQKKLNREKRLETIKNAYKIADQKIINKEIKKNNGKFPDEICLIDDVCTTGATVESCSEILKKNGIKVVNVITLFVVD